MARRVLYLFLMFLLSSNPIIADNYAILISAGKATSDNTITNTEYWFDLYLVYEYLLLEEHYDSTKVFVFYGNGTDYNSSNNRYKKQLHNWGQITDYDNSRSTLNNIIPSLNNVITDRDNVLFYWITGHAIKADATLDDSYFAIVNFNPYNPDDPNKYYLNKNELLYLINSITHYNKRKIMWMTCYSGAMGGGNYNPNNDRTTLITSSNTNEKSYSNNYLNNNISEPHADFNYALLSLSTGVYPDGTTCNLNQYCQSQSIEDSLLSVKELHSGISTFVSYLPNFSTQPEHPCLFDIGNIGPKIFLGEDKKLKTVLINTNSSYWVDRMNLSNVELNNTSIIIDIDDYCSAKNNIFVPIGSTLQIK